MASLRVRKTTTADMKNLIIIIDDDEPVRDSLSALLVSAGYAVSAYECCEGFLESKDVAAADALVLDQHMCAMTGVELVERLMADGSTTPIIMISGNLTPAVESRALRAGVIDVLEKPLSDDQLLDSLRRALKIA